MCNNCRQYWTNKGLKYSAFAFCLQPKFSLYLVCGVQVLIYFPLSSRRSDPMLVSQADALQAEASTKLKGMLAAAATVPPAPTQVAATPVVTSAADAGCKKAPTPADASSTKRPRDAVDERAPKKPAQEQPAPSGRALPSEASANISKSASVQSSVQQASRSSDVQNAVLAAAAAATHVATPSATKLTENSVSSLEGDCAEVEDIQAKVQAELAW